MPERERRGRAWRYVLLSALVLLFIAGIAVGIFVRHLTPIVRQQALDMLRSRFDRTRAGLRVMDRRRDQRLCERWTAGRFSG